MLMVMTMTISYDEYDDDDNNICNVTNDHTDDSSAGVLRHTELHRLDQHNLFCQVHNTHKR